MEESHAGGPSSSDRAELAAAVDLGSNSFHMIVGRLEAGQLHVVDKLREGVRFASGLDVDGNITHEAMDRALACLERLGQRLHGMDAARVRVVGTNTLRQAHNSRAFMDRAEIALGYPIEIISGLEEARLIYLGVAQTMPDEGRRLVVDIGGGSTEVIIGEGFDILEADSLYMGCVSFSQRFFPSDELTSACFRDAEVAAELEIQSIAHAYRLTGWNAAVGCSGTVHAIQTIVQQNGWSEEGITQRSLKKLRKALIAAGSLGALSLPGLQQDRKPVIAGGTAILEALFTDLRIDKMVASPGALREGVLYDLVGRINHEDVRDRTIRWLQQNYQVDVEHAENVEATALTLLDQATRVWDLDETWAQQQLSWAARLHEIGLAISHTGYHKHGAYLANNVHMAGFSRGEQELLATLIAGHRRKIRPSLFDAVPPGLVPHVTNLCVLFRLAVSLNRGRDATRPAFVLKVKKHRLKLVFPSGFLHDHPLTRAALAAETRYLSGVGYELVIKSAAHA